MARGKGAVMHTCAEKKRQEQVFLFLSFFGFFTASY